MADKHFNKINNTAENRNLFTLISGNVIAQLIPFIFSPVLSRYFSPQQFGELALLMGITNPIATIICLRYDTAIVVPEQESHARDLLRKSLSITLVISILTTAICIFLMFCFKELPIVKKIENILPFIAPVLLSIGIYSAIGFFLQRKKQFKNIALLKIMQMGAMTIFNLVFAFLYLKNGLNIGYLMGWLIGATAALLIVIYLLKINIFKTENKSEKYLHKYRHFPIYNGIPEFLSTIALSIPVFIFIDQFGEDETGYFNLCRQVLYFPASFISVALSQYYFQRLTESFRTQQKLLPIINKIGLLTFPISLAMIIVLVLAGPWLFSFVFGQNWLIAGNMAKLLCVLFALQLCVVPMQTLFTAVGKNQLFGLFKLLSFIVNLILLFINYQSPEEFLWIYTLTEGCIWLLSLITVYYISNNLDRKLKHVE